MKNLLIITQKVDAEDDLLGFFVDWLNEFAKHFDNIFVITLAKGVYDLPSNVHVYSLGKERASSRVVRILRFYSLLFRFMPQVSGVFAHMSPIFAIAAWPAAVLRGKKIVLWYLHRSVTLKLKMAEKICFKIVTAARESLQFDSGKIIETGHGIRTELYKTDRDWNLPEMNILSVGRISQIKNLETLLEAAKILKTRGYVPKITIAGRPIMSPDLEYFERLKSLKDTLDLGSMVEFIGFVSHDIIPELYKLSQIVIGLTPRGGVDKTLLEGMASGCLTLTSNDVCAKYFGEHASRLIFTYRDPENLADKIESILKLSPEDKTAISDHLSVSVQRYHDLKNLASTIARLY